MEKIKFTAEENSFIVEAEGKKLRVSYAEFFGNYEDSMKFCKENDGGDENVENLRFLAKHHDVINNELVKLDKEKISGWYWSNEVTWCRNDCAFVVNTNYGYVYYDYRYRNPNARAVSAL